MVWHQVNAVGFLFCFFVCFSAPPSPLCAFPCERIDSKVKEESVISIVIAHSPAPSATLAFKTTLCATGHGGFSFPSHSLHLSVLCFFVKRYLLFPNEMEGNSDEKESVTYLVTVRSVRVRRGDCLCRQCIRAFIFLGLCMKYM